MSEERIRESYFKYAEFMYSAKNIGNCAECPENIGHNGHECNGNPCGQQNCWVAIHCADESEVMA